MQFMLRTFPSAFLLALLCCSHSLSADVVINEFLAANGDTTVDEDGETADWIELYNPGNEAVDMDGWYLTDNPLQKNKWRFPDVQIQPGAYLTIFASGKNRSVAGEELHANFQIDSDGEYLALVRSDGVTVADEFSPGFPPQRRDISYGLSSETVTFIAADSAAEVLVPADDTLGSEWTLEGFTPSTEWQMSVPLGIGFQTSEVDPQESDALGYWSFDGHTLDAKEVNDGTFVGGVQPTYTEGFDGMSNGAIDFDGVNDYVELPGGNGLPVFNSPAYTICMWVKGFPQPDYRIYNEGSTSNNTPLFTMGTEHSGSGNTLDIYIRTTGGTSVNHVNSQQAVFDGSWHHIAWIDEAGDARLYVDGVLDGTDFSYNKQNLSLNVASIACVLRAAPSHWFRGSIDDVAIWQRALTPDEVADLAAGMSPGAGLSYADAIGTDLSDQMDGVNASAYIRIPFEYDGADTFDSLQLRVKYDDGFVAYLNGVEVASRNAPAVLSWNAQALDEREPVDALRFESINITEHLPLLHAGWNVLAVHLLNSDKSDGDLLFVPELHATVSGGSLFYFTAPTFNGPNGFGLPGFVRDTMFSVDRGFFEEPFHVEITTETPGAEIRYTLDGSAPTESNGFLYSGPILIDGTTMLRAVAFAEGLLPTNVDTQTYIFLDDVLHQTGAEYPRDWIPDQWYDIYKMDPDVVNDPDYADTIKDDMKSIPTLSVVLPVDEVFDEARGIYANSTRDGPGWERPCSAELIYPSGAEGFQVNCGVEMHGGSSRNWGSTPKHSYRLQFKGIYGPTKLRYPLFQDTQAREFQTLVLRACYTDSWTCRYNLPRYHPEDSQFIRDQWMRDMQLGMGHPSCHGKCVHLYVCGIYWGLYNIAERPDDEFAALHLGDDTDEPEEYDVVKDSNLFRGSKSRWNTMIAYAKAGLGSESAYQRIQEYADVDNLIDYMILHLYGGAEDWAHHNWSAAARQTTEEPFVFFVWDQEIVIDREYGLGRDYSDEREDDSPAIVHYNLRSNREYRLRFADHVHRHFFNGGILTPEGASKVYSRRAEEVSRAVVGECAKWGDYRRATPYSRDIEWAGTRDWLYDVYFPQRPAIVMAQFRNDSLYPDVEAPSFSRHGGVVEKGYQLVMTHENSTGTIYYTLDGSDPREYGTGDVADHAVSYTGSVAISDFTQVKARVLGAGAEWSALNEAWFRLSRDVDALRITEIMYNPVRSETVDGDFYEFLEFKNTGNETIDLSGVSVSGAVEYTFAEGAVLSPGEFLLLVSSMDHFMERYGNVVPAGAYVNRLSNAGEFIQVLDGNGREVVSFAFYDKPPWPFEADGTGRSLVIDRQSPDFVDDPGSPHYWRTSLSFGGSPGMDDSSSTAGYQLPGDVNQDVRLDLSDAISILLYLFSSETITLPCEGGTADAGGNLLLFDINGDEGVNISDVVALLSYLFAGGEPPVLGTGCIPMEGCPTVCF